jgi:hypothetical protein
MRRSSSNAKVRFSEDIQVNEIQKDFSISTQEEEVFGSMMEKINTAKKKNKEFEEFMNELKGR